MLINERPQLPDTYAVARASIATSNPQDGSDQCYALISPSSGLQMAQLGKIRR